MLSLTRSQALTWRLGRHGLDPVGTGSVTDVVGALGAVAAQLDPSWAELGIRLRCHTSAAGDVARALADGTLVKTFAFRGATHLMTPAQAAVHLPLRASSRMWERRSWREHYRLEPDDWPGLRAAVREALTDGPMTRDELAAALAGHPRFAHLGPAVTDPAATILKPFAWQGDACLGPARDGHLTLQRLDTNPHWPGMLPLDEAGPRAVEAYLHAYGPASPDHLRYWLGEGLGVRAGLIREWTARLAERVSTVEVDAEPLLALSADLDDLSATRPTSSVRLLPRYDQWVLGPGTADTRVVPAPLRPAVSRGADVVVVDGVVTGTWSLTDDAVVLTSGDEGPRPDDDALDAELRRLADVLGRPLHRT